MMTVGLQSLKSVRCKFPKNILISIFKYQFC